MRLELKVEIMRPLIEIYVVRINKKVAHNQDQQRERGRGGGGNKFSPQTLSKTMFERTFSYLFLSTTIRNVNLDLLFFLLKDYKITTQK